MKRLGMLVLLAACAGCGGFKNTDPLSGLAGATDTALYNFESSAQGWACSSSQGGKCNSVSQANGLSFAGQGSLQVLLNALTNHYPSNPSCPGTDDAARVSVVLGSGYPDLTGHTLRAWVYIPAAAAYSKDLPTQAQIFLVQNSGSKYANGPGVNLIPDTWNEVTYAPVANPDLINPKSLAGGTYMAAGFDPNGISEIGIKIAPAGAAPCTFTYTGYVLVDSISY